MCHAGHDQLNPQTTAEPFLLSFRDRVQLVTSEPHVPRITKSYAYRITLVEWKALYDIADSTSTAPRPSCPLNGDIGWLSIQAFTGIDLVRAMDGVCRYVKSIVRNVPYLRNPKGLSFVPFATEMTSWQNGTYCHVIVTTGGVSIDNQIY
jgi:hypothetical protein